jgi:hypothetical protein
VAGCKLVSGDEGLSGDFYFAATTETASSKSLGTTKCSVGRSCPKQNSETSLRRHRRKWDTVLLSVPALQLEES